MKFAHLLLQLASTSEDFRVLHACYKQAKKGIKRIGEGGPQPLASNVQEAEARFAAALLSSVQGLNAIRSSRLEKCCREMQQLEAHAELSARAAVGIDDKHELLRTLVHFHGEALLAMNWSIMAYTTILKILKKHQKRTGLLVQAPELRDVLSQPSWSTEAMAALVNRAEAMITVLQQELRAQLGEQAVSTGGGGEGAASVHLATPGGGQEATAAGGPQYAAAAAHSTGGPAHVYAHAHSPHPSLRYGQQQGAAAAGAQSPAAAAAQQGQLQLFSHLSDTLSSDPESDVEASVMDEDEEGSEDEDEVMQDRDAGPAVSQSSGAGSAGAATGGRGRSGGSGGQQVQQPAQAVRNQQQQALSGQQQLLPLDQQQPLPAAAQVAGGQQGLGVGPPGLGVGAAVPGASLGQAQSLLLQGQLPPNQSSGSSSNQLPSLNPSDAAGGRVVGAAGQAPSVVGGQGGAAMSLQGPPAAAGAAATASSGPALSNGSVGALACAAGASAAAQQLQQHGGFVQGGQLGQGGRGFPVPGAAHGVVGGSPLDGSSPAGCSPVGGSPPGPGPVFGLVTAGSSNWQRSWPLDRSSMPMETVAEGAAAAAGTRVEATATGAAEAGALHAGSGCGAQAVAAAGAVAGAAAAAGAGAGLQGRGAQAGLSLEEGEGAHLPAEQGAGQGAEAAGPSVGMSAIAAGRPAHARAQHGHERSGGLAASGLPHGPQHDPSSSLLMTQMRAALDAWQYLQQSSSTPSTVVVTGAAVGAGPGPAAAAAATVAGQGLGPGGLGGAGVGAASGPGMGGGGTPHS